MTSTTSLLLILVSMATGAWSRPHSSRFYDWRHPALPQFGSVSVTNETMATFTGGHVPARLRSDCGLECQLARDQRPRALDEIERDMSYETLDLLTGMRALHMVKMLKLAEEDGAEARAAAEYQRMTSSPRWTPLSRGKRTIFGYDTRYSLPTLKFANVFPFSSVVKISTGCSGVLISPKYVLTSAHCIHDGQSYLKVSYDSLRRSQGF